jgi:hypothetical protein
MVGEWVWLRLHQLVASLDIKGRGNFGHKIFRPFRVLDRVDDVAYKMELLPGTKLHNVLHVDLLKPYHGTPSEGPGVLPSTRHGVTP